MDLCRPVAQWTGYGDWGHGQPLIPTQQFAYLGGQPVHGERFLDELNPLVKHPSMQDQNRPGAPPGCLEPAPDGGWEVRPHH